MRLSRLVQTVTVLALVITTYATVESNDPGQYYDRGYIPYTGYGIRVID